MARPCQREPWELKAEDLVRHLRGLLDYHREPIENAMREALGEGEARARLDQLAALTRALEQELWRVAVSDPSTGHAIVQALKDGVGKILATAALTSVATLATTEAYQALRNTEAKADQVIECVIEDDDLGRNNRLILPGKEDRDKRPMARIRADSDGLLRPGADASSEAGARWLAAEYSEPSEP